MRKRKYKLNLDYFENIDTEEKAYFLGLMAADGCVKKIPTDSYCVCIGLQDRDKEILLKFNKSIGSTRPLFFSRRYKPHHRDRYRLIFSGKKIGNDLIKHGIVPNKTFLLKHPAFLNKELFRHYLRGQSDGDGCIHVGKTRYWALVATRDCCVNIQKFLLEELQVSSSIVSCHNHPVVSKIRIIGNIQLSRFLDWLYKDAKIYLRRKYRKYQSFTKEYRSRYNKDGTMTSGQKKKWIKTRLGKTTPGRMYKYKFLCNQNQRVYTSINVAAGELGINPICLGRYLRGKNKSIGSYTFKLIEKIPCRAPYEK